MAMSDDEKNKEKHSAHKGKLVQFPGRHEDDLEEPGDSMLPVFMDYFFPVTIEFSSVTAAEVLNFSNEALSMIQRNELTSELIDMLFVKLRGLSLIVPTVETVELAADLSGTYGEFEPPDLSYAHEVLEEAINSMEELAVACAEEQGGKDSKRGKPLSASFIKKHDAKRILVEARDTAEEILMELGALAEQLPMLTGEDIPEDED